MQELFMDEEYYAGFVIFICWWFFWSENVVVVMFHSCKQYLQNDSLIKTSTGGKSHTSGVMQETQTYRIILSQLQ